MKKYFKDIIIPLVVFSALGYLAVHHLTTKSDTYLRNRVVRIFSDHAMCSGEQVRAASGVDYILTAAHCLDLAHGGMYSVRLEDGSVIERRFISEDYNSDLLLIEGLPNLRGLDIADKVEMHSRIRTFTHGHNMDTFRTEGELIEKQHVQVLMGVLKSPEETAACVLKPKNKAETIMSLFGPVDLCLLDTFEYASTAFILPGSSGGPIVDSNGDLVAVVSAGGSGLGMFVTLEDIQAFLKGY